MAKRPLKPQTGFDELQIEIGDKKVKIDISGCGRFINPALIIEGLGLLPTDKRD